MPIKITNLAPGAYVINEIKAPDGGYVIDTCGSIAIGNPLMLSPDFPPL